MSTNYYLTGKTRNRELKITFNTNSGQAYDGVATKFSDGSLITNAPIFNDTIEFLHIGNLFVLKRNGTQLLAVTIPTNSIISIAGEVRYNYTTKEAIVLEEIGYAYDDVGEVDYPIKRRMKVVEIIENEDISISASLNSNSTSIVQHIDFMEIVQYSGYVSAGSTCGIYFTPQTYNNYSHTNSATVNVVLDGFSLFPPNLSDSDIQIRSGSGYTLTEEAQLSVNNNFSTYNHVLVDGTPPPEEGEVVSHVSFEGSSVIPKKIVLNVKVYDLDKVSNEQTTINVLNESIVFTGATSKTYEQIYIYGFNYQCLTKTGNFYKSVPSYDVVRISSVYGRFLFRTFLYNAITQLNYTNILDVGEYLNESHYQPIKDCRIEKVGDTIHVLVYNEGGGLGGQSINPNYSACRYNINGGANDFYFDSHRFLKLRLSSYYSSDVDLYVKIGNKEYHKQITDLSSTPADYYFDLCAPTNSTQQIDYKNNNFDEDDSYSDYWGITKTRNIEIYYDNSFVLHEIKITDRLPDEAGKAYEHKYTVLGQRSTWQNGKRRLFVVRNRGKQTLELPDALTDSELTINNICDEINTDRWNGWSATRASYASCSHTGNIHNLIPCLINLDTPASFLRGCGNTYDGTNDYNHINKDYVDGAAYNAQMLVDEIVFYPDCGDVFFDTNNNNRSGAIKLYASLIRRAQANGLVGNENINVVMYKSDGTHNAGSDTSDYYDYYYIVGDYAKKAEYKVEPSGYGLVAVKNCFDANEYRICFRTVTGGGIIINDVNIHEGKIVTTTNINNSDGYIVFLHSDMQGYVKGHNVYSSCDVEGELIIAAQDFIVGHSFDLQHRVFLKQLPENMLPFVITDSGEVYVTYYDTSTSNFVFERYDCNFNLLSRYTNIINTIPVGASIPVQNFPITVSGGMFIGVFVYGYQDAFYLQFVSSVNGKIWIKQKEVAL